MAGCRQPARPHPQEERAFEERRRAALEQAGLGAGEIAAFAAEFGWPGGDPELFRMVLATAAVALAQARAEERDRRRRREAERRLAARLRAAKKRRGPHAP